MIMAQTVPLPPLDPLGLPAPPQLFVFLYLLTMLLHVLFMNLVLGGNVLALALNVAALRGRQEANSIANLIYQMTPAGISMAVTMGVAPLLFLQVLYGPFFYSANVLMGFAWFSFVIVLLIGFYIAHWLALRGSNALQQRLGRWDEQPGRRMVLGLFTTTTLLWVAWILTNNHELSLRPSLWPDGEAWRSPRFYVAASTTIMRYLHNVVGATAIAGLWLVAIGWWRINRQSGIDQTNRTMVRFGLLSAAGLTIIQLVIGPLFFISLEDVARHQLMGFKTGLGTIWTLVLIVAIALPIFIVYTTMKGTEFKSSLLSIIGGGVVVTGMLLGHEQVRLAMLAAVKPHGFTLSAWTIYPQWFSVILFIILLVTALVVVVVMLRWFVCSPFRANASQTKMVE